MDNQNKYKLGLYEKSMPKELSWEDKFICCKEAGFDYLELSIDESNEKLKRLDMSDNEIALIRSLSTMYEVPIQSICLSGHRKYPLGSKDQKIQSYSLEVMYKAIALAKKLGVRLIQLAGYDVYYEQGDEQTKENFLKNLKKCVQHASMHGVVLGFETMETPFMDTVEKSMVYVKQVNSPYLGVYPDIGNLKNASLRYGVSVNEDLEKGRGHIFAMHLKETIPNHYREIAFGSGHTEFVENIEAALQQGISMFVGEFWYTGSEQWKQDLLYANTFLRDKIAQACEKINVT